MGITYFLKWVWNEPWPALDMHCFLLPKNDEYGNLYHLDVIWYLEFYFQDVELSTRKQNIGIIIIQILSSLCPTSHYKVTNIDRKQPQDA